MKFYVTTPIYYVNDVPHIGHAFTTVAADVLARLERIKGKDVFFLTGTDEHGAKIAQAAKNRGLSPKELCDQNAAAFIEAWRSLLITNDYFIRTTDERHENAVKLFMEKLFSSGYIYKGKYEGLYCIGCEKFLTREELDENLCCPDHKQKPMIHSEENYYFKLSSFRKVLLELLTNEDDPRHIKVVPIERRNEIIGKLKISLEDISISRAAVEWGIPLPFDHVQSLYVWVDALLNYITAIGYGDDKAQFAAYWPADVHLMAKDILWFHSVIWPALLLAAELPLPQSVAAHGFFTIAGEKMSKTLGNVIYPQELVQKFGPDASRYLLLALIPFSSDGNISWAALIEKYNTDLANNFGNLVSRTLTMVDKYFSGKVPPPPTEQKLIGRVSETLYAVDEYIEHQNYTHSIEVIQKAIDLANRYVESTAPWKLAKEGDPLLGGILFELINVTGQVCLQLTPFMPQVAQKVWEQIGETGSVESASKEHFQRKGISSQAAFPHPGNSVQKGEILFPRIT